MNHDFAVDLLSELSKNSISMICTEKLLDELIDHAEWAIRYYKDKEFDDIAYYTAVVGSDFRQNLFLDGSMKWSIGKNVSTFSDYMTSLFSSTDISLYRNIFSKELEKIGVSIISMDQLPNFQVELYSAYEEAFEQIKTERTARLTYKNDRQCETEAELVIISRIHPISFLTHTSNLKQITSREEILHWSPEIMYRFIKLNSTSTELTDLYSCMIGDFLSCGFKVLDKETIAAFSSPLFKQARTQLDLLKNEFGDVLDKFLTEENVSRHQNDLTLPFFALQTQLFATRKLKERNIASEKIIQELQATRSLDSAERNELLRLRSKKADRVKKAQNRKKTNKKKKKK